RRWTGRARRRLSPGHGVALAGRCIHRGVGPRARRERRGEARGAHPFPSPARRRARPGRARPPARGRRRRAPAARGRLSVPGMVAGRAGSPATGGVVVTLDPEATRLAVDARKEADWRRWGPYLSDRQWATVREDYSEWGSCWDYFPHDHAR